MKKLNIKEAQIIKLLILVIATIIWFTIKISIQSPLYENSRADKAQINARP